MAKKTEVNYEFLNEFAKDTAGYEGLDMSTAAIPFIRILQTLSPQLKKNKPEFINGSEEGDIVNSITGKIYEKPLRVVIGKFEHLFIEWKPNRGGFVQAHSPKLIDQDPKYAMVEENGRMKLKDTSNGNDIVETYIYYIILPDYIEDSVCILSLSSSQLKEARRLNRMLLTTYIPGTSQKALPHFIIWKMDTVEMSNDQGDWYGLKFTKAGFVSPDLLESVMSERKALPDKTVDYAQIDDKAGKENVTDSNVGF